MTLLPFLICSLAGQYTMWFIPGIFVSILAWFTVLPLFLHNLCISLCILCLRGTNAVLDMLLPHGTPKYCTIVGNLFSKAVLLNLVWRKCRPALPMTYHKFTYFHQVLIQYDSVAGAQLEIVKGRGETIKKSTLKLFEEVSVLGFYRDLGYL